MQIFATFFFFDVSWLCVFCVDLVYGWQHAIFFIHFFICMPLFLHTYIAKFSKRIHWIEIFFLLSSRCCYSPLFCLNMVNNTSEIKLKKKNRKNGDMKRKALEREKVQKPSENLWVHCSRDNDRTYQILFVSLFPRQFHLGNDSKITDVPIFSRCLHFSTEWRLKNINSIIINNVK